MVLYLCSSPFIAPHEVGFVRKWIAAIRSSADERLRGANVLVRPHPQNAKQWSDVDLASEFDHVALWPKAGVNPIGGAARSDYFDSMFYSEAVVGVNTSGMIESGIIGKPVYSIVAAEFAATQEGTLHFQHLKNVEGGLLHLASDLREHTAQLAHLLADGREERLRARQFIQGFVRPHGLDVPATPRVVAEVERLGATRVRRRRLSLSAVIVRVLSAPAAVVAMIATLDPEKSRAVLWRWTRPVRLVIRGLISRAIYTARFLWRVPRRVVRLALTAWRRLVMSPLRWIYHFGKMRIHALLVARKGEPDQVP